MGSRTPSWPHTVHFTTGSTAHRIHQDFLGSGAANAKDVLQGELNALAVGNLHVVHTQSHNLQGRAPRGSRSLQSSCKHGHPGLRRKSSRTTGGFQMKRKAECNAWMRAVPLGAACPHESAHTTKRSVTIHAIQQAAGSMPLSTHCKTNLQLKYASLAAYLHRLSGLHWPGRRERTAALQPAPAQRVYSIPKQCVIGINASSLATRTTARIAVSMVPFQGHKGLQ